MEPKVSTEEILAKLKEECEANKGAEARAMKRSFFAEWMCNERGMTMTPAIARLVLLRRRGLIGMGYNPPEDYPIPGGQVGLKSIFLWPVKEGTVENARATREDRLLVKLREVCPAGRPPVTMRGIYRAVGLDLNLSLSSIHRLLHKLKEQGRVECVNTGWVCAAGAPAVEEVE